jgi:hypothetical protein
MTLFTRTKARFEALLQQVEDSRSASLEVQVAAATAVEPELAAVEADMV